MSIDYNHRNSRPFSATYLVLVVKIVFRIVIFRKILDGDPTKITKMSRNIDQHRVIAEKPWFSRSEQLRSPARGNWWPKLKNRYFLSETRPDRSKSRKLNTFFGHLPPYDMQNRVQNRDFSENPRSGPYKNHKNVTKKRFPWGNCWKIVIFTFWTALITRKMQLVAGPEKLWFLSRKSSGSLKITKILHLFQQFTSLWSSKSRSESWFFGKSSMGTLQKSQKCHEKSIFSK